MGGLPGPSGGDSDSAEDHTDQTEADGPEVPEPRTVAGGDGEGGKYQRSPTVGQRHQRDTAEETQGQRKEDVECNILFKRQWFKSHIEDGSC